MLGALVYVNFVLHHSIFQGQALSAKELVAFFKSIESPPPSEQEEYLPADYKKTMKEQAEFTQALAVLQTTYTTDQPQKIANQWLNLLDKTLVGGYQAYRTPDAVLRTVPTYQSWPMIAQGIRKNYGSRTSANAAALTMYGELLGGTLDTQKKALANLKSRYKGKEGTSYLNQIQRILDGKKETFMATTLTHLMALAKKPGNYVYISSMHWELAKANREAFFKQLFTEAKSPIYSVVLPDQDVVLLNKWFKETAPQHKIAHWNMVDLLDTQGIYPIIAKRFNPNTKEADNETSGHRARSHYLAGLAANGDISKAVAGAGDGTQLKFYEDGDYYANLGIAASKKIAQFLAQVAAKNPNSAAWEPLTLFSILSQDATVFEATAKAALTSPKVTAKSKPTIQYYYANALLANDKPEQAVPLLQAASKVEGNRVSWDAMSKLSTLAKLFKHPEWAPAGETQQTVDSSTQKVFDLLNAGKQEEAKKLMVENGAGFYADGVMTLFLFQYVAKKDSKNLIDLIDNYEWSTNPEYLMSMDLSDSGETGSLVASFTQALTDAGRGAEAGAFARKALYKNQVDDNAYIALINAEGEAAIPLLDKLAALNPYEERPLIWKAKVLLSLGRVEEAKETVLAAIKIDPSDGETGEGRRMVVYTVYADILDAQGKSDDASLYRNAVAAIRKSEVADQFLQLGMVKRAIRMYQESLEMFANAYCIQSRLAHHLASQGRKAEALEHYRKAYELMSSSFGYVETHCFGCEQVFDGDDQQALAEEVFQEQIRKSPEVPQNHYLLGYLRQEQGRNDEAAKYFREALRLAPAYANAAKHLLETGVKLSPTERASAEALVHKLSKASPDGYQYNEDNLKYKELYLEVLNRMKVFGIDGDVNAKIPFKIRKDQAYGYSEYISGSFSGWSTPGQRISTQTAISAVIQLVQSIRYEPQVIAPIKR